MDVAKIAAQGRVLLHQVHLEALVGDAQRRGHARQPAADNQRRCRHRQLAGLQRLQMPRPGDGHGHQVHGLIGGRHGVVLVDPGALVADVGHRKEVLVEPALAQRLLEEDLVRPRRTGGHHQPVEPVLLDHVLDVLLVGVRAGVEAGFGVADVGHLGRLAGYPFHVDDRSDVVAAVADEHAHPRGFVGGVALPGVFVALDQIAARGGKLVHGARRRRRGLRHRFRNVLGFLERPGHVNAGLGCRQRRQPLGLREAKLVEIEPQPPGHLPYARRNPQPHAEHHQVEFLLLLDARLVEVANARRLGAGHLHHARGNGPDELHAVLVAGAVDVAVELLAERPHIHAEDRDVELLPMRVLQGDHGLLGGAHAADGRAVAVAAGGVPAAHALDESDLLHLAAIRRPLDMAAGRTRGREHPLELHAREHVGVAPVAELAAQRGLELLEARREDDAADADLVFGSACWSWHTAPAEHAFTHCIHSLHRPQARHRWASAMACSGL